MVGTACALREDSWGKKGVVIALLVIGGHARRRAIRQLLKARWRAWSAGVLPRGEGGGTGKDAHDKKFQNTRMGGARAGSTQVFLRALLKNEFCGFCDHNVARARRSIRNVKSECPGEAWIRDGRGGVGFHRSDDQGYVPGAR